LWTVVTKLSPVKIDEKPTMNTPKPIAMTDFCV
jgi:hypothetical protein